jgi:fermentation-respiration switch protein FrsA (DUF1100 family)
MRLSNFAVLAALAAPSLLSAQSAPSTSQAIAPQYATPLAGSWNYSAAADGSEASFVDGGGRPQLILHCARAARRVTIAKPATVAAPFIVVWTSSLSRSIPASFDPLTGRISVSLPSYDPLLDAMVFSRGRLAVTVSGTATLVVPAWPEVARAVEDCRG